jgi:hypothetical protein|tara:strand:+ start:1224 stop:2039 length:816 start_codon:yes stop_codon:yes gene_type:complete
MNLKINKILVSFFFSLFLVLFFSSLNAQSNLLSYKSEYEISLGDSDLVRLPGKTYVDKASGYLLIDWINNCDNSWVSNQRMMTRFINSHGVGTVSEINYSINENIDGKDMDFLLEVKEDAELVNRVYGEANLKDKLVVKFPKTDKKDINFPGEVVFPHKFLEEIISNLFSDKRMITKKVYEGTIPEKFFNISVFITDKIIKESDVKLSEKINNKFKQIRMSYYQDNDQTPIFEQTVNLNDQGLANYFKYDYTEYSLVLKLKKVSLVSLDCD